MKLEIVSGGDLVRFAWQSAAIAVAACGLVFLASAATSFKDLNAWTYDFTVLAGGDQTVSKDIVLVDFDEESFARIAKYPIPRSTFAELIAEIEKQQPKIVGMDIFLSEARTPQEDLAMQTALTNSGNPNVIVASQSSSGVLPSVIPLPIFCQPEDARAATGYCRENTPGALGYAFVNLPFDSDGFIRRSWLFVAGPPKAVSFPLFLAMNYTGQAIEPVDHSHGRFNGHPVYYSDDTESAVLIGSWARQPVPVIPAWKVLTGAVPANALTGKLVLIGQTNDAARDRLFSPVFRREDADGSRLRLGGTEILGAAIRSLLEGKVVRPATPAVLWTAVLLFAWAASFAMLTLRPLPGFLCTVVLAILPSVISVYLYSHARYWLPFFPVQLGVELTLPLSLGLQFILERVVAHEAREQRKQLMTLFASYVDPAVAKTIWARRSEVSLGGEERVATVVFTDIRNFTKLSAGKPPAEVLKWLNMYVTEMDKVIRDYNGFLNKFIGDGLMIIFGLPLSQGPSEDARLAIEASLAMLRSVTKLNERNKDNPSIPQLRIGIGIHTGTLMAGSIGSASRQEYSVIGATVNLASRLESLNKPLKTEILMSRATHDMVAREFSGIRPLGRSSVAGLEEQIEVFTIDPQSAETEAQPKYVALLDEERGQKWTA